METIYKKDSKGKIRFLTITTEEHLLVQTSGVLGTDNPVVNKSVCESKNVGKTNATTAAEQAISELKSKITEKLRQGYFKTQEEAQAEGGKDFLLPMLAKDYKKEVGKVKFPCFAQPKLDGMRALLSSDSVFMSRTGKEIETVGHIEYPVEASDNVLDGELYAYGLNFQENMRLLKKYRKGETEQIKYHVYDVVMDLPFKDRRDFLIKNVLGYDGIDLVETVILTNEGDLKRYHAENINRGYEGTIVRHGDSGYDVNKRSSSLLKYKDFIDIDLPILDIIPMESRPEHGQAIFTWKGAKGHPKGDNVLGSGTKLSHQERIDLLKNKQEYIGKKANLRFFEYSETGVPRFPVMVGIHEDR